MAMLMLVKGIVGVHWFVDLLRVIRLWLLELPVLDGAVAIQVSMGCTQGFAWSQDGLKW